MRTWGHCVALRVHVLQTEEGWQNVRRRGPCGQLRLQKVSELVNSEKNGYAYEPLISGGGRISPLLNRRLEPGVELPMVISADSLR
jgi:hypothetical protein